MYSQNSFKKIFLTVLLFIGLSTLHAQNIEISFTSIRSTKGQLVVKVYIDDKGFQDDKPIKTLKYKKADIIKGEMDAKLDLDPGTYGFALLDDENLNNVMEYGFFGMPEEGFGFSNYYLTGLFKPKFEQFKFTVNKDQKQKVVMKIKYL